MPDEIEDEEVCETWGHDEDVTWEDDEEIQFRCLRCGAEWWEDA